MKKIGCFTISSFTGIPLCTQLFEGLFYDINNGAVEVHQCYITGFVSYSDKIRNRPVIRFNSFNEFIKQSALTKFWKYLVVFFRMLGFTLRNKNIVVYSIDVYSVCVGLLFKRLLFLRQIKVVYHQFEMDIPGNKTAIERFFFKLLKRNAAKLDVFIVPEINRLDYFRQFVNVSSEACLVFPNTTQNHFSGHKQKDKVIFAHIGAFGSNHYGRELIAAFSRITHHAELWVIGRITSDMHEFIHAELADNIKIVGAVPHHELKTFYEKIDFGLILYKPFDLNNAFAAPNKLYEMWSYGIPVIAPELEGLKGVYKNGCLGKLVNMEDHDSFVAALDHCSKNPESFDRKCISDFFSAHYSLDHHITALKEKL